VLRRALSLSLPGLALLLTALVQAQAPESLPSPPPERRAAYIVGQMTLAEKVLQMQNNAPAIERLGIPAYQWWSEALHGVARLGDATVFPQAIGLAATWDTDLMHRVADIVSTEARAKWNEAQRTHSRLNMGLDFWSPNINIFRDPRWGRGQETYGEDPFLTSRMAIAFIKGLQGDDPHYFKVIATAKHYAVHSGPEPLRHAFNVTPSRRDLEQTYLPAFRASVMEGKVDSLMCAYNSVDGVPACANKDLLRKNLDAWGFQGYVVSDCGAIANIYKENEHHYTNTEAEASAAAVKAGTDLTCGNEYRSLVDAVKAGLITEAEIDKSLEKLFVARIKLGLFDPAERVPFSKIPASEIDSAEHRAVALEAARKSIVLLKNDKQTLPLAASVRKIAVIGPSADDPVALLGNYNGISTKQVTPLEGIEKRYAGKAEVRYELGATYTTESPALVPPSALQPPSGAGQGVLAHYYDNPNFQGTPKLERVEARIFQQQMLPDPAVAAAIATPPLTGMGLGDGTGHEFGATGPTASVRWTGTLRPPVTGDYAIGGGGRGFGRFGATPMHIFLDDKELAAPTPANAGRGMRRGAAPLAHIQMEAGHAYRLRVEYKMYGPAGNAQLSWIPPAEPLLAPAIEAVKSSDVAVVFVGLNSNLEGEEMPVHIPGFAGGDRTDIRLPDTQERLVESAIATGKPVVVVLTSGSAIAANFAADHAAALLQLWYGGEECGTAIADTLAGVNNPAGRLPVTFYRTVEQLPAFDDYNMDGHTYRYFKGDPLYSFGFGLSYSTFEYSALRARRTGNGALISVRVKNTSAREGDEVAQLYVDGSGELGDPIRSLRGFERVHLRTGETREIQFFLKAEDVPTSKVRVSVGGGQPQSPLPHVVGEL